MNPVVDLKDGRVAEVEFEHKEKKVEVAAAVGEDPNKPHEVTRRVTSVKIIVKEGANELGSIKAQRVCHPKDNFSRAQGRFHVMRAALDKKAENANLLSANNRKLIAEAFLVPAARKVKKERIAAGR